MAGRIDGEIHHILSAQYGRAKDILARNLEGLHRTAALLMKYERVTGEEFEKVYRGQDMDSVMAPSKKAPAAEAAPDAEEAKENE